jgi:hypothetical protein
MACICCLVGLVYVHDDNIGAAVVLMNSSGRCCERE